MKKNIAEFIFAGTMLLLFLKALSVSNEFTINSVVSSLSYINPFIVGFTAYYLTLLLISILQIKDLFKIHNATQPNTSIEDNKLLYRSHQKVFGAFAFQGYHFFLGVSAVLSLNHIKMQYTHKDIFSHTLSHPFHTLELFVVLYFVIFLIYNFIIDLDSEAI